MNELVASQPRQLVADVSPFSPRAPHALLADSGDAGRIVWEEFFLGQIRNHHTRLAYGRAVSRFLDWANAHATPLRSITPGMIGDYLDKLNVSIPTKKVELAALRGFFDTLVSRHLLQLNPAATVRGERYSCVEGKTAEISPTQARELLESIDTSTAIGLRDRAIIATLIYTAARAGAVAKLRLKHFVFDGVRYSLQFAEKGGKARDIAVSNKLQIMILDYLRITEGHENWSAETPLFRSVQGRTDRLSATGISGSDICRIVKRRIRRAGLPPRVSPHSFRVLAITNLLSNGKSIEDVQNLAGHTDIRTTQLYDRRPKHITRDLVESISV